MAKEPTVTTSITLWSAARVRTGQRLETTSANMRAANGESTQITNSSTMSRGGCWLARNHKPMEPAAPVSTAVRPAARRRPRNLPSGLSGLTLEVMLPRPLMLRTVLLKHLDQGLFLLLGHPFAGAGEAHYHSITTGWPASG